jgi:hypothetical protein
MLGGKVVVFQAQPRRADARILPKRTIYGKFQKKYCSNNHPTA